MPDDIPAPEFASQMKHQSVERWVQASAKRSDLQQLAALNMFFELRGSEGVEQLIQRSLGVSQELMKLGVRPTEPLSDISTHRFDRVFRLCPEPHIAYERRALCQRIDGKSDLIGELPANQFGEMARSGHAPSEA